MKDIAAELGVHPKTVSRALPLVAQNQGLGVGPQQGQVIVHHDQDPVFTGYAWTSQLLAQRSRARLLRAAWSQRQPPDGGFQQPLQDEKPIPASRCTHAGESAQRRGRKDGLLQPRAKAFIHRLPSTRELRRDSAAMVVVPQFRTVNTVRKTGCTASYQMSLQRSSM